MAYRDDLGAAQARAEAAEQRTRELEEHIRKMGAAKKLGGVGGVVAFIAVAVVTLFAGYLSYQGFAGKLDLFGAGVGWGTVCFIDLISMFRLWPDWPKKKNPLYSRREKPQT